MEPYAEITRKWTQFGRGDLTRQSYKLAIQKQDKAKLEQLLKCYPRLDKAEILRDLLAAALLDMEQSMPYEQGNKVISHDEWGEEIYEDSGLTPKFLQLTKEFQSQLKSELLGSSLTADCEQTKAIAK